ncbi:hypothetical protein TNCV_1141091 [Trichonephila clavipes]|nr:hypothetical protein TNCV_1141091 [Trichonephila clavipes]
MDDRILYTPGQGHTLKALESKKLVPGVCQNGQSQSGINFREISVTLPDNSGLPSFTLTETRAFPQSLGSEKCVCALFWGVERESEIGFKKFP